MVHLLMDDHHALCAPHVLPALWVADFTRSIYLARHPDRYISGPADLSTADAIIVRSATRLTAPLLASATHLRAVVTCSSGTDHIDLKFASEAGLSVFSGRGGNAIAVAEWVAWALARQWRCDLTSPQPWAERRLIVVGVGAVGSCVRALAEQLGATVICVDPPRAGLDPDFAARSTTMTLTEALRSPCDALTLHVPRVTTGPHCTVDLIDATVLERLRGAALLNAARGGVVVESAAAAARRSGQLAGLWCDTFTAEPHPDPDFVAACDGATPHIAGHSIAGKLKVAWLPMLQLRQLFGLPGDVDIVSAVHDARVSVSALPAAASEVASMNFMTVLDAAAAAMAQGSATAIEPYDFRRLRAAHVRQEGGVLDAAAAAQALLEVGCPQSLAYICDSF